MIGADVLNRMFALRVVAPFHRLDDTELLLIAQHAGRRVVAPGRTLVAAGTVADVLFVRLQGSVLIGGVAAPAVFDAAGLLFGLGARGDQVVGPEGLTALVIAKPHVFTIARECPEFVVGLRGLIDAGRP